MNRRLLRLLSLCLLLPAAGCWSATEINDNAIVIAVFLDRADDGNVEVTLGFPLTSRMITNQSGTANPGRSFTTVSERDVDVAAAVRKIQSDLSRRITWGHMRIIVIGRELAQDGIYDDLEYFGRLPLFHFKTLMFVAPGKAGDIAKLTPAFERFPPEVLQEFVRFQLTQETTVLDVLKAYHYGGDTLIPLLTIGKKPMLSEKGKRSVWVGTGGAALFRDGKMVGSLNEAEARGALWIGRSAQESVITVDAGEDGGRVSAIVAKAEIAKRPRIANGRLRFEIRVAADDDLISVESAFDVSDPKAIDRLERKLERDIEERVRQAFRTTQSLEADVFQVGQYMEWYYPKEWSRLKPEWRSHYKNIALDAAVTVNVRRPGSLRNPIWEEQPTP